MTGKSIVPIISDKQESVRTESDVTIFFQRHHAGVWQGRWKLVNVEVPFDEANFELYNLADDPGETTNLSEKHPAKHAALLDKWRSERRRLGILLPQDL